MVNTDAMNEVEGTLFAAEMNLAAGKKAFNRSMIDHPIFRLLRESAKHTEGRAAIINRILALAAKPVDPEYENPADVAFCLRIVDETAGSEMVATAVATVLSAPNCSWAVDAKDLLAKAIASGVT